jgi:hypothetical protein
VEDAELEATARSREVSMNTPLEIAVDIGRIVLEAQRESAPLDVGGSADELLLRFPQSGLSRRQIVDALREEASAVGLTLN